MCSVTDMYTYIGIVIYFRKWKVGDGERETYEKYLQSTYAKYICIK